MKNKLKTNKGITLIALVITIIVLLILAGVAISMLSGENGILNQAAKAKTLTDEKSTEEQIKLAVAAAMTNETHTINQDDLENELIKEFGEESYDKETGILKVGDKTYYIGSNGDITEKRDLAELKNSEEKLVNNTLAEDVNGDKIIIPKNFHISKESPLKVTEGIVIEDSENNQYVWIPVFKKTAERTWGVDYKVAGVTSEKDYINIEKALKTYTNTYANNNGRYLDMWYGDINYGKYGYYDASDTEKKNLKYYTNGNMTKTEYDTLYHNMLKSIYNNGGFYIGRYEMGIEVVEDTTRAQDITRTKLKEYIAKDDNTGTAPSIEGMSIPISQANAVPYNYITQSQAEMLAEKLGQEGDYSNVATSIMFGVEWDAVCVFIEHYDENNNNGSSWLKENTYSKEWGNYDESSFTMNNGFYSTTYKAVTVIWNNKSGTPKGENTSWMCTTGASDQNKSLNIYDFAGNLSEWTLERFKSADGPSTFRGYSIFYTSTTGSAYCRDYLADFTSEYFISSRFSLYIR